VFGRNAFSSQEIDVLKKTFWVRLTLALDMAQFKAGTTLLGHSVIVGFGFHPKNGQMLWDQIV